MLSLPSILDHPMSSKVTRYMLSYARRFLSRQGYVSFREQADFHYVPKYFGASAGKQPDIRTSPLFGEVATEVITQKRTLLYYDRLYMIYQALAHLSRSPDQAKHVAEVGVYQGGGSYFIASILKALKVEGLTLHCFDTFEGHSAKDIQEYDTIHKPGMFDDTEFESVKRHLEVFTNIALYKGRFQENCSQIASYRFGFVHLDVDLFEVTQYGLEFFAPRMLTGGCIIVDDYGFATCPGVKQAVDDFVAKHAEYTGLYLLTGQYLLVNAADTR